MAETAPTIQNQTGKQPGMNSLLKPYLGLIVFLIILTVASNALGLIIPKIIAEAIDGFAQSNSATSSMGQVFSLHSTIIAFSVVAFLVFILTILQSIVQTYASERVARDLRRDVSNSISRQTYAYVEGVSPAKLLTNLTSDIDSIKSYISVAFVSLISSVVLIIGAGTLLLLTNWRLALVVLLILPFIGITFFLVLQKVRSLFLKSREIIDKLNKVINESILGAALIRVLYSRDTEHAKFARTNTEAQDLGMRILSLFAAMIPVVTFIASLSTLAILTLGGHFVIVGSMSLGNFAAFNSYVIIMIFPIFVLGFTSSVIAQAQASYTRVGAVLYATPSEKDAEKNRVESVKIDGKDNGKDDKEKILTGSIEMKNVSLIYGEKNLEKKVLKDISLTIKPNTKTAIIGPTAAGKTQLLYALIGLISPTSGVIEYDGRPMADYDTTVLHRQIGFVFQDSVMFNLSVRENIAFSDSTKDAFANDAIQKAIDTAELGDFVDALPNKLDTVVSERGTSLSGGQKQRIMLARALALNPKILLLDDFTARVDRNTEQKILSNVEKNYPDLTLISVTQKISSVEHYDQIILLMEGEVLATGTHAELMQASPEYVQIYNSQQSTNHYELQS